MSAQRFFTLFTTLSLLVLLGCAEENPDGTSIIYLDPITTTFEGSIDLNNLANYSKQPFPSYIQKDNTVENSITNAGATLGRVLFYDKNLSVDNTVSCATCHQQAFAFSDPDPRSTGVNGVTGRHSMRLVNARFADEDRFFWDERAATLEEQTTQPIQDHAEMGFSGVDGSPGMSDLIEKLEDELYYLPLFDRAFGTPQITEARMQSALAQFIRSIQSFDSRYDEGRAMVANDMMPFPNFTPQENMGKNLYMEATLFDGNTGVRTGGGLGCQNCHRAPEFDIDPNSNNNGVIGVAGSPGMNDLSNTRSPSLRDLFNSEGGLNGPMMHTGNFGNINMVINHYNNLNDAGNPSLDFRLARGGGVQMNITPMERQALIAFLHTLSGQDMYTNEKWSDPFPEE